MQRYISSTHIEMHRDCNFIKRNYNKLKLNFDPRKDASNHAKHGLSLGMAEELEWGTLQCKADTRREYDEPRQIGYAISGERLYCVVFVDRPADAPTERRIISLRKANRREVSQYGKND